MSWGDVAATVAATGATALATALGGPGAGAAVRFIADKLMGKPDATEAEVRQAIAGMTPEQAIRLRELDVQWMTTEATLKAQAEIETLKAQVASIQAVNETMRSEAASEHWPTYTWRPLIGGAFAFDMIAGAILVIVTYAPAFIGRAPNAEAVAALPAAISALTMLAGVAVPILGVASWFRGRMQADPNIKTNNLG